MDIPLDENDLPGKKENEEGTSMLFSSPLSNSGGDVGAYFGEVGWYGGLGGA
jgi:hypothetical protein